MQTIQIKYFSAKAYFTLDLPKLFEAIFDSFGEAKVILEPMNSVEKANASENIEGIEAIKERFIVFKLGNDGDFIRCTDIEVKSVQEGIK